MPSLRQTTWSFSVDRKITYIRLVIMLIVKAISSRLI
jgi:hypothetical protein